MTRGYPGDLMTPYFSVAVINQDTIAGIETLHIRTKDRFHKWQHLLSRQTINLFARTLDRYLSKRPHLDFDHPSNHVRRIVHFPPAFQAWTAYMPGGFATYSVHNPDHKRLYNGKKIDYITRNLFRHSLDAIGLRSRAYTMAWFVHFAMRSRKHINWVSVAAGTGQPVFDAARILVAETTFYLCDRDSEALRFARQLAKTYDITDDYLFTSRFDVTREGVLEKMIDDTGADVVDAMGFFEYLDDDQMVTVLAIVNNTLKSDGIFLFSNMLDSRRQLNLHRRGMGWPDVIVRSPEVVASLMDKAGIAKNRRMLLLPDDGVYGVYVVKGAGRRYVE